MLQAAPAKVQTARRQQVVVKAQAEQRPIERRAVLGLVAAAGEYQRTQPPLPPPRQPRWSSCTLNTNPSFPCSAVAVLGLGAGAAEAAQPAPKNSSVASKEGEQSSWPAASHVLCSRLLPSTQVPHAPLF